MRQNPHVRICGGPGSATTLVYPTGRPHDGLAHDDPTRVQVLWESQSAWMGLHVLSPPARGSSTCSTSGMTSPLLTSESVERQSNLPIGELLLTFAPRIGGCYDLIRPLDGIPSGDPMDGGE